MYRLAEPSGLRAASWRLVDLILIADKASSSAGSVGSSLSIGRERGSWCAFDLTIQKGDHTKHNDMFTKELPSSLALAIWLS